uniref:C2H2-type domain-containing protein n=1 Tax=Steinernema glaseri TaxID=37863 RepID=A0A1I8ADT0_9BILA
MEENSTSRQDSYVCQQCHSTFDSFEQFACHMRDHIKASENDRLSCKICGVIFSSPQTKAQFFQHQNDKHVEVLYRCKICLQFFSTEHALENHVISHAQTKEIYSCIFCNIPFQNKEQLAIHIQLVHDSNVPVDRVVPALSAQDLSPRETHLQGRLLKCSVCDAVCLTDTELDEHRLLYHCKVLKGERCGECYKVIASTADFLEHSVLHNGDRTEISCIVCRQTIRDTIQLNLHGAFHMELAYANKEGEVVQSADGKISPSSASSESTSSASNVRNEPEPRDKDRTKFRCAHCPKEFSSQSALQGHSHVHMKYKTFRCEKCTLCFSSAARLASHQKRHLAEQNVTCQICDMSFTDLGLTLALFLRLVLMFWLKSFGV